MSPSSVLQVLVAYLFVDLLTGLYHWATDKGLNHPHQVELFSLHHETNTMDGFDWQPSVIGLPTIAAGLLLGSSFLIAAGGFAILSQVPHYYAHRRSSAPLVHHFVCILQLTGLIISPRHHAEHHKTFDRNFCILSGWNNWWLNQVVRLFDQ
jgi:sterol desaturase/sphingolipid hydroxylase (fatty acid hydroxylase superfamily)